jgi:hypothetical protein
MANFLLWERLIMRTLKEVLDKQINGLHYGNRVLLPFYAEVLKIVIKNKIITDFGKSKHGAYVRNTSSYTDIYFNDYENLLEEIAEYDVIKIVLVENDKDIFDFKNHVILQLEIKENHKLVIKPLEEDIIFLE